MKVTFIQPPIEDFYSTPIRRQPLGLLYLAAAAAQKGWETALINGHSPKKKKMVLPESFYYLKEWMGHPDPLYRFPFQNYYHFGMSYEEIRRQIKQNPSSLFAVSSLFTPYFEETLKIINIIREEYPEALILTGGPHASLYPDFYLKDKKADFVIIGEAEEALFKLLTALERQDKTMLGEFSNILSIDRLDHYQICPVSDLDSLAFPKRDLLKERDFKILRQKGVSLVFSRGCPHACSFCTSRVVFGKTYRKRSIENLMAEIDECVGKLGITFFNFEDDNLFREPELSFHLLETLLRYQEKKGLRLDFAAMNGTSIESLNYDLLKAMRSAGFQEINLSLVTASISRQEKLKRPFDTSLFEQIVMQAKTLGLNIRAYFILGLPGQTQEEVRDTLSFLKRLNIKAIPSVYYNVQSNPEVWKIQRSSAFANETEYFSRKDLISFFNQTVFQL